MPSFIFKEWDILNTTLLPTETYPGNFSYTIATTSTRFLGNKLTTVTPGGGHSSARSGAIDWREGTFIIGDITKKVTDLKRKPHGLMSLSQYVFFIDTLTSWAKLPVYIERESGAGRKGAISSSTTKSSGL
jgi:hypothetical protein